MGLGQTHKQEFKMLSTCTTKKKRRLVQVEWKWCGGLSKDNFKHKASHGPQPLGGGTTPFPIVYFVPFHADYIQMSLFFGTLVVPKFWMFIFFEIKSVLRV